MLSVQPNHTAVIPGVHPDGSTWRFCGSDVFGTWASTTSPWKAEEAFEGHWEATEGGRIPVILVALWLKTLMIFVFCGVAFDGVIWHGILCVCLFAQVWSLQKLSWDKAFFLSQQEKHQIKVVRPKPRNILRKPRVNQYSDSLSKHQGIEKIKSTAQCRKKPSCWEPFERQLYTSTFKRFSWWKTTCTNTKVYRVYENHQPLTNALPTGWQFLQKSSFPAVQTILWIWKG